MESCPWHVLHVITNHERRVAQHLVVRDVEHYLPLYAERAKWTDRTVVAERPLFAGYVFARFDPQSRIPVISIPGVLRLLSSETRDMVSDEELARIREGLASGLLLRPHQGVSVGTPVRVRDGIFAGAEGTVMELRHQCRVIITLSATHQCFSLEVALGDLEVLKKSVAKPVLKTVPAYGY